MDYVDYGQEHLPKDCDLVESWDRLGHTNGRITLDSSSVVTSTSSKPVNTGSITLCASAHRVMVIMITSVQVVYVRCERHEESRYVAGEDERSKKQYNGSWESPAHRCPVLVLGGQAMDYPSIKKWSERSVAPQAGRPEGRLGQCTPLHHPGFLMPYAAT